MSGENLILKVDETPTSIGGGKNKLVLVGVQSPSKINMFDPLCFLDRHKIDALCLR